MRQDDLSLPDPPTNDRPGDRWTCGAHADAPCAQGPGAFGICPLQSACRPRRTWHGRKKQIITFAMAVTTLALVIAFGSSLRATVLNPGDLATPHAQILAETNTAKRCASCHTEAAVRPGQWFAHGQDGHDSVGQSERCLNCHHTTLDRSTAMLAHNLPASVRDDLRRNAVPRGQDSWHDWMPGPAFEQENIECSVCHREHHGANHDIAAVSNQQCQTCHSDRFGSFAESHPDWAEWPYTRDRSIAFDHFSHSSKHFPATKHGSASPQFQCARCHVRQSNNELTRVASYERACQSCHDKSLGIRLADGIEILSLPTIPRAVAAQLDHWPESATGFLDGIIPPLESLLLRNSDEMSAVLRRIPNRDLSRLDPDSVQTHEIVRRVAVETLNLIDGIASEGHASLLQRATELGIQKSTLVPLLRSLPPQLIQDASQRWFRNRSDTATSQTRRKFPSTIAAKPDEDLLLVDESHDDLLSDNASQDTTDPLGTADPLGAPTANHISPQQAGGSSSLDAEQLVTAGGWYVDQSRMAVRYRAVEHRDPTLRATIEMLRELSPGDPDRTRLLNNPAVAACIQCHAAAHNVGGQWTSISRIGGATDLTRFSHAPHLNISHLNDCVHCHRVVHDRRPSNGSAAVSPDVESSAKSPGVDDFQPIGRDICGSCHTRQSAGDQCTKCHRYHVDLR